MRQGASPAYSVKQREEVLLLWSTSLLAVHTVLLPALGSRSPSQLLLAPLHVEMGTGAGPGLPSDARAQRFAVSLLEQSWPRVHELKLSPLFGCGGSASCLRPHPLMGPGLALGDRRWYCPAALGKKLSFLSLIRLFKKNMWQINVSRRCQMWEDVEEEGVCAPGRMYPAYPLRALWGCAGRDCGSAGHTILWQCPRGYSALRRFNIALKWGEQRGFIFPGGQGGGLVMSPCPLVSPWRAWGCGSGGDELLKSIGAFGSSVSSEGPVIALTSAT